MGSRILRPAMESTDACLVVMDSPPSPRLNPVLPWFCDGWMHFCTSHGTFEVDPTVSC